MNREFLYNTFVLSFLLSIAFGILFTKMINSQQQFSVGSSLFESSIVFTVIFLVLYVFHLIISVLSLIVSRWTVNMLAVKLVIFNGIGLLLVGMVYYLFKDMMLLYLLVSLVGFSLTALISNKNKDSTV